MKTLYGTDYAIRVISSEPGSFSCEQRVKLRSYKGGKLTDEYLAIPNNNFDFERGLVRVVSAKKKGEKATVVVNVSGCGGNEWLDIPVEDLVEVEPEEDFD